MPLYHVTGLCNLPSILKLGLLKSKAQDRIKAVWACEKVRVSWAIGHVCEKHGWLYDEITVLEIRDNPFEWVPNGKGLWKKLGDVDTGCIHDSQSLMSNTQAYEDH